MNNYTLGKVVDSFESLTYLINVLGNKHLVKYHNLQFLHYLINHDGNPERMPNLMLTFCEDNIKNSDTPLIEKRTTKTMLFFKRHYYVLSDEGYRVYRNAVEQVKLTNAELAISLADVNDMEHLLSFMDGGVLAHFSNTADYFLTLTSLSGEVKLGAYRSYVSFSMYLKEILPTKYIELANQKYSMHEITMIGNNISDVFIYWLLYWDWSYGHKNIPERFIKSMLNIKDAPVEPSIVADYLETRREQIIPITTSHTKKRASKKKTATAISNTYEGDDDDYLSSRSSSSIDVSFIDTSLDFGGCDSSFDSGSCDCSCGD